MAWNRSDLVRRSANGALRERGYTTVTNVLRDIRPTALPLDIRFETPPGDQAQVESFHAIGLQFPGLPAGVQRSLLRPFHQFVSVSDIFSSANGGRRAVTNTPSRPDGGIVLRPKRTCRPPFRDHIKDAVNFHRMIEISMHWERFRCDTKIPALSWRTGSESFARHHKRNGSPAQLRAEIR